MCAEPLFLTDKAATGLDYFSFLGIVICCSLFQKKNFPQKDLVWGCTMLFPIMYDLLDWESHNHMGSTSASFWG